MATKKKQAEEKVVKAEDTTKVEDVNGPKKIKVKILTHAMAGKYLMVYNHGDIVKMEEKQAQLLIENGDAEIVN